MGAACKLVATRKRIFSESWQAVIRPGAILHRTTNPNPELPLNDHGRYQNQIDSIWNAFWSGGDPRCQERMLSSI